MSTGPETSPRMALWIPILITVSSWSYLRIWAQAYESGRIDYLPWLHLVAWTALFMALAFVALSVSRVVTGRLTPASLAATTTGLIAVQSWSLADDLSSEPGLVLAAGLFISAIAVAGAHRLGSSPAASAVFAVLTVALIGLPLLAVASHLLGAVSSTTQQAPATPAPAVQAPTAMPDVMILVLDAYARSDVLAEEFGFDNSGFESRLAAHGLQIVEEATTVYSGTQSSVAALLDLDYPIDGGVVTRSDRQRLATLASGGARLFDDLRSLGYTLEYYENPWTFTSCGEEVDVCIASGTIDELDYAVLGQTPLPWLFQSLGINPWLTSAVRQARHLTRQGTVAGSGPTVTYVHLILPHPPFQLRADCSTYYDPLLNGYAFFGPDQDRRVAGYLAQIECANRLVEAMVESLAPDAAMIITGDHGSEFLRPGGVPASEFTATHLRERFGVFMAIRLPDSCEPVPGDLTTLNAARRLDACITGRQLDDLEARYYYLEAVAGGNTATDVTDLVPSITQP